MNHKNEKVKFKFKIVNEIVVCGSSSKSSFVKNNFTIFTLRKCKFLKRIWGRRIFEMK
jgi:hypothetical protein